MTSSITPKSRLVIEEPVVTITCEPFLQLLCAIWSSVRIAVSQADVGLAEVCSLEMSKQSKLTFLRDSMERHKA